MYEAGGLLSEYEKSEIEQRIECECKGGAIGLGSAGQEEESVDASTSIGPGFLAFKLHIIKSW